MIELIALPPVIAPDEWFVVFHEQAATRWLGLMTPGRYKHVSAFAYVPGVARWLLFDAHWGGIRIWLVDKGSIMEWSRGCAVVKIATCDGRMAWRQRLGFTCVTAVKHLIRLKGGCVAATPSALYRDVIRNGGILISEPGPTAPAPARSDADAGAADGAGQHGLVAAGTDRG